MIQMFVCLRVLWKLLHGKAATWWTRRKWSNSFFGFPGTSLHSLVKMGFLLLGDFVVLLDVGFLNNPIWIDHVVNGHSKGLQSEIFFFFPSIVYFWNQILGCWMFFINNIEVQESSLYCSSNSLKKLRKNTLS